MSNDTNDNLNILLLHRGKFGKLKKTSTFYRAVSQKTGF